MGMQKGMYMSARKFSQESLVAERSVRKSRHFRGTGGGRAFGRWWKKTAARVARRVGIPAAVVELDAAPLRAEAKAAFRRLQSASAHAAVDSIHISFRWADSPMDQMVVHSD